MSQLVLSVPEEPVEGAAERVAEIALIGFHGPTGS